MAYTDEDLEEIIRQRMLNKAGTPLLDGPQVDTSFLDQTMGVNPMNYQQPEYPLEMLSGLGRGLESVTDAPRRAGVAAGIQGQNPFSAFASQFGENPDNAPNQEQINEIAKLRYRQQYPDSLMSDDVAGMPELDVGPMGALGEIKGVIQGGKPFFDTYEKLDTVRPKLGLARAQYVPKQDASPIASVFEKNMEKIAARFDAGSLPTKLSNEMPTKKMGESLLVDTYGSMDVHNAPLTVSGKKYVGEDVPMPLPSNLGKIEQAILNHNGPIVLGNDVDPFMWSDSKYGQTKAILPLLKGKNATIRTRSDLIGHDDYWPLVKDAGARVEIILPPIFNNEIVRILEPGAPSIQRRIQAAEKLKQNGVSVSYKIQPLNDYIKASSSKKIGFNPSNLTNHEDKLNDLSLKRLIKKYSKEE